MRPRILRHGATALVLLGLVCTPLTLPAQAQTQPQQQDSATTTKVTFNERAERSLPRDKVAADLSVEASDPDARHLQDLINRRMAAALAKAKAAANITVTTTGYNLYQVRPEKGPPHWEGRQGLHLESKDSAALLTLVGALQADGLTISSFAASISPEVLRAVQDELTTEALHRVAQRAANIAATLDMRILRYVTLQVGNTDAPPHFIQPMMRAAVAMAPAPAPPVAAAGEETVSVSVNAEVELAPKR